MRPLIFVKIAYLLVSSTHILAWKRLIINHTGFVIVQNMMISVILEGSVLPFPYMMGIHAEKNIKIIITKDLYNPPTRVNITKTAGAVHSIMRKAGIEHGN